MELFITAQSVTGRVAPVKIKLKSTSEVLQVPFRNSRTDIQDAAGLINYPDDFRHECLQ